MTIATEYFDEDYDLPNFITHRERKLSNRKKKELMKKTNQQIHINRIHPLTETQTKAFDAFDNGSNCLLHGVAGTGKTFIALYKALESVVNGQSARPIVILRSVVPSRDMGFLPGKIEEKAEPYEAPYHTICEEITGHATAYDYFKKNNYIQFSTTSHLRGLTFKNNIVIVDECQNCSGQELNTIITRVGDGCRIIFCGDFRQSDLHNQRDKADFTNFMRILRKMPSFECIEFGMEDVVRSGLVKEYINAQTELNIQF